MDFELNPAQEEIVRQVSALCARFPDEYWRDKDERHEFPHDFYQAFAKSGYLGVAIPEEYGGSGLGITEAALVMREVAGSGGAMNAASSVHLSIFGVSPLVRHGNEEQKRRYLPKIINGELQVAFSVTEPDAGNDITHIKTFAWDAQGNETEADIPTAIKHLLDAGYKGVWGIESCPKDGDEYGGVRKTIALINRLVPAS